MAGEQQTNNTPRVAEVEIGTDSNASVDLSLRGKDSTVQMDGGQSASIDLDPRDLAAKPEGDKPATGDPVDEPEAPAEPAGEPEAALPDFDPANDEVRGKYDQRYFTEEGKLNLATLTKEFWGNAKDNTPGTLNAGTYKYLEAQLGLTKDAVTSIEKGLVAQQRESNSAFFNKVGGRQRWGEALEWGKKNYTPEQRERFNAVLQGSDGIARDEAVEALMARFGKVSPAPSRRGPPRRGASPDRSATTQASPGAGASAGNVPYPTQADYQTAWGKALAAERSAKTPAEKREAEAAREKVRTDGRSSQRNWAK